MYNPERTNHAQSDANFSGGFDTSFILSMGSGVFRLAGV
jgi:hypothetical protein